MGASSNVLLPLFSQSLSRGPIACHRITCRGLTGLTKQQTRTMASNVDQFLFRQLFEKESSTYTYLLAHKTTKEAILIDPVFETVDRDLGLIKDLNLVLKYAINTHMHADHITGTGKIKSLDSNVISIISSNSGAKADQHVSEGDRIPFGPWSLEVRETPGHTNGCVTYVDHEHRRAFTGDTLLIRGCGRTDFQEGDPGKMYDMVHSKIFTLPPDFALYPAHDYKGLTSTTVEEEARLNPRMTRSREDFVRFMKEELKLAYPKKIDMALPWNKVCGIQELVTDEAAVKAAVGDPK